MSSSLTSRRSFFTASLASAAGLAMINDVCAEDPPGKAVEDRATSIRISSLRAIPTGTKVYVKIETNLKVTGWGEITGLEPKVAAALAESLLELLKDENPTRIEYLWQKLYRSHRDMRGGPFMVHCISAIDMALWDIAGKLHNVPVYRLLGGPTRDKIRMYPTPKAFKVPAGGPKPWSGDPPEIEGLLRNIAEHRKRVGPDGTLMFDAHCCLPPPLLIQFANSLPPTELLFLEEFATPGNIEVFKRIKQAVRIPLATGERDRTIWEVLPYLQHNCVDIMQPDCGHTGGISQMKKIATLCETFTVPIAPHCTMSELGLSASMHAVAAIPNFLIQEGYLDGHIMPPGVARKSFEIDKNGDASLPQGPGLGVEMDEEAMAKVALDPKRVYKWPVQKLKDGGISDY